MLTRDQIEQLRDDGAVLLGNHGPYWVNDTGRHNEQIVLHHAPIVLVNTLAALGHAMPFVFNDEEAQADWKARRAAFIAEETTFEDKDSSAQRVPRMWTEPEPMPLMGFYVTCDLGRDIIRRVHPDDRVSYAWELGQQAADSCLGRNRSRRAYTVDMVNHG